MHDRVALLALPARIFIAAIFVFSGFGKLAAPAATIAYIASAQLPAPTLGYAVALFVELVGGLLLILGYRTRAVAAVLALFTLATAVLFHTDFADQNQVVQFMKNLAIAGGLLHIVALGAGSYSLDSRRSPS